MKTEVCKAQCDVMKYQVKYFTANAFNIDSSSVKLRSVI
jgi:hypothetical protein